MEGNFARVLAPMLGEVYRRLDGKAGGVLIPTRGDPLVLIPLSLGGKHGDGKMKYALIDAADYPRISEYKWCADLCKKTGVFYAATAAPTLQTRTRLHRFLLGLRHGDRRQGDHRNHVTLDNRRENLRIATNAQNTQHQHRRRTNGSGFKGVNINGGRWVARIRKDYRQHHIGNFNTPEEAARAYDRVARQLHGEFAKVNFP